MLGDVVDQDDKVESILQSIVVPHDERRPGVGEQFPDVTFTAANGAAARPMSVTQGPLLLVFFRGFW